jgi:hypothetical protein
MSDSSFPVIYQLKVVLLGISPMIWRRLLVKSDSTIEDWHYTLQIAMGWEDIHLHHFIIHGKQYGITQPGGIIFSDCAERSAGGNRARVVKLATLGFRVKERFIYEYDFSIHPAMGAWRYWWRHEMRVEAILTPQTNQLYPVCVGGKGVCPNTARLRRKRGLCSRLAYENTSRLRLLFLRLLPLAVQSII